MMSLPTNSSASSGLDPVFNASEPAFRDVLAAIQDLAPDIERIASGDSSLCGERPARFEQDWFPRLDAVAAYSLVRRARPRTIIEIGSGHSTRFLAQAIVDGRLGTDLVCIDPKPRAPIAGLPLRHLARPFDRSDAAMAPALGAGDMLFIDSSHVAMPGTELEILILEVLPRLGPGVLIHFHDIFLPDPYPASWTNRGYNEQIMVAALMQGGAYAPVFASHFVAAKTDLLAGTLIEELPFVPGAYEGSLWLRKSRAMS